MSRAKRGAPSFLSLASQKNRARGTLAREKTPPLQVCCSKNTGPHGLKDNTKWTSTNGQTCESIYTSKNKKSHCKQANKHGVTGNDACQCSC